MTEEQKELVIASLVKFVERVSSKVHYMSLYRQRHNEVKNASKSGKKYHDRQYGSTKGVSRQPSDLAKKSEIEAVCIEYEKILC